MEWQDRVLKKLDDMDHKLDNFAERIAVNEEKHQTVRGHIKALFAFVLALITAGISYIFDHIKS